MKRIFVFAIAVLMMAQYSWAARARISPILDDPYVSAELMDAATGRVLFSKKANSAVYPASVVKMMDLLIILERIERGENRLDEMVQITPESAKMGGSQVYLDPKEQFSIEDLLYALMVQSANDAAVALAIHISGSKEGFVTLMNKKAAELGMKNTQFHSVHGLPPSKGQNPDQTTAHDIALLSRALVNRQDALVYTSTRVRDFRGGDFVLRSHNHLLEDFFGCDGLKTGFYQAAGFSIAATAERAGNRVIAVVMGSRERKVRDAKAMELLSKGFALLPAKDEPEGPVVAAAGSASEKAVNQAVAEPPAAIKEQEGQQAPAVQPVQVAKLQAEADKEDSGGVQWLTFFIGVIVGLLLPKVKYIVRRKKSFRRTPNYLR